MNEDKRLRRYYNFPSTIALLLVALKLDGRLEWSWLCVLFVPMWVDIALGILVHIIFGLWGNRSRRQDKPYGKRLHWDSQNKRMYGPFEEDN